MKKTDRLKRILLLLPSLLLLVGALSVCAKGLIRGPQQPESRGLYMSRTEEMRRNLDEEARLRRQEAAEKAANERGELAQSRLVRSPLVTPVGGGMDEVTILVYMNGSDLESFNGFASQDIREMLGAASSDKVHILIQTMGTKQWQDFNIASDHSQRFEIDQQQLVLLDDGLPQLDCTDPATLLDFLKWGSTLHPADRYFLILWDHGGGSVEGFGYDEWLGEDHSLTMDEMTAALQQSGLVFDFIGMDACIMSSIEVCYALYDYCDYCVLSEDFESALGWAYGGWLDALARNSSIDTVSLSKILIDDMVETNAVEYFGSSSTLALIDERYIPAAFDAWKDFAYENEDTLLSVNYSREIKRSGRAHPRVSSVMAECYITDLLALAVSIPSPMTKSLVSRLASCVAYYNCSFDNTGLTGLSVTLPYGDPEFYASLGQVFAGIGIDKRYIQWLGNFQNNSAASNYYDYYEFDHQWQGWDDFSY
ncbi:MAG: hypothetical protein K6E50_04260 [Lachnospiraceae bacterium]|nr:hypothetical protein [Lachnospiraceae bacterium]